MQWLLKYVISRLKEKSSLGTIVTIILGSFGIKEFPELKEAIMAFMSGIISLIAILTREKESD